MPKPMTREWLDQVAEDVVDPAQRIVDPHHHLWPDGGALPYDLAALSTDTSSGHAVKRTVFVECGAAYRSDGPAYLAPTGETEFVAGEVLRDPNRLIGGIVAHADLAAVRVLDGVLDMHTELGQGLFRGIRHRAARHPNSESLLHRDEAKEGIYADPAFRQGVARLGRRSLTFDAWHYHHQNRDFAALARAVPDTPMVLDHFGGPLGMGPNAEGRKEIFEQWRTDIRELAKCENVVAKLGGLAMPESGFNWHKAGLPPTSDQFVAQQEPFYLHTIESFGPDRCMFESNFPIDRFSLSYRVLWNGFKKIAAPFSPAERNAMFYGTAVRVYRLQD